MFYFFSDNIKSARNIFRLILYVCTPDSFDFELLLKDLDLIWELRKYIPIGPYR